MDNSVEQYWSQVVMLQAAYLNDYQDQYLDYVERSRRNEGMGALHLLSYLWRDGPNYRLDVAKDVLWIPLSSLEGTEATRLVQAQGPSPLKGEFVVLFVHSVDPMIDNRSPFSEYMRRSVQGRDEWQNAYCCPGRLLSTAVEDFGGDLVVAGKAYPGKTKRVLRYSGRVRGQDTLLIRARPF